MKPQTTSPPASSTFEHLSEEALNDFLIGLPSPKSETHLADCQICRDKVQIFRSDLQTFNNASLIWSESKPPINLRPLIASRATSSWVASRIWVMAVVVLLLLGGALLRYQRTAVPNTNPDAVPFAVDDDAQIAQDNQMLQSVEMALNDNETPAIEEYHLSDSPHPHPKARSGLKHP